MKCLLVLLAWVAGVAWGQSDLRIRTYAYQPDQIYALIGTVGYDLEIDLASDETYLGLSAGDLAALGYSAHEHTISLKPRVARVHTNLTIYTSKHRYLFDYTVAPRASGDTPEDAIYLVRFTYPPEPPPPVSAAETIESALTQATERRRRNYDYWYCGSAAIKPAQAFDDGIHTYLEFPARAEQPAIFVRNEDGSESLLNFNMDHGEVVIYRVARRLILRRGKLTGCVVNKAFDGGGERLDSGTISPDVKRTTEAPRP